LLDRWNLREDFAFENAQEYSVSPMSQFTVWTEYPTDPDWQTLLYGSANAILGAGRSGPVGFNRCEVAGRAGAFLGRGERNQRGGEQEKTNYHVKLFLRRSGTCATEQMVL